MQVTHGCTHDQPYVRVRVIERQQRIPKQVEREGLGIRAMIKQYFDHISFISGPIWTHFGLFSMDFNAAGLPIQKTSQLVETSFQLAPHFIQSAATTTNLLCKLMQLQLQVQSLSVQVRFSCSLLQFMQLDF